ncbi:MAG: 50S ribosomal protein L15 [Deltaproteobacteria bacterium]|nr:50S ribosomal protein L15 [Deltaproteobacteria bacterium]
MKLNELRPPSGAKQSVKRLGRGIGSGLGKTSGRGHKGYGSRTGSKKKRGYEGGQNPLHRRLPKVGFTNIFRQSWQIVNIAQLEKLNGDVTPEILASVGLIQSAGGPVKILGNGDIKAKLKVVAHRFSDGARKKIEGAGGSVEVLPHPRAPKAETGAAAKA